MCIHMLYVSVYTLTGNNISYLCAACTQYRQFDEIFRRAKQMVKERQDITGLNCIKGASGKVIVDDKGIKDSWKEYMKEENEWE